MSITIGALTLSDGTRAEPARLAGGSGSRAVQASHPIRGDAKLYGRQGRRFEETLEVSYSYATPALARAGWVTRRAAALAQDKAAYADNGTAIGNALVETVALVWNDGCGITIAYHITGELA